MALAAILKTVKWPYLYHFWTDSY